MKPLNAILIVCAIGAIAWFGFWRFDTVWSECRAAGYSKLFCWSVAGGH